MERYRCAAPIEKAGESEIYKFNLPSKYHSLKHGDPVVIWGEPSEMRRMGSGEKSWALNYTQMVAYRTPENFMENFILPGVWTARAFGWVGFGCIFLSPIPAFFGIRRYLWLKKHGSDEPPPPTIPMHQRRRAGTRPCQKKAAP